jgi:SAM-dependent methyltransferase
MDLPTLAALLGDEGTALLDEACLCYGREDTLALSARLRRRHPPALVAAALTQARLRARAADKLGPADAVRMLFTDEGLQQATRQPVAAHRATRLAAALGPGPRVLDLGCGIGADLVALARTGLDVTGVERDPLTAAVARHNAAALGLVGRARVLEGDLTEADRGHADAVY